MSLEPIPGQPGLFRSDKGEIINIRDFREDAKYSTVYIPIHVSKRQMMKKSKKWLVSEVARLQAELDAARDAQQKTHELFWDRESTLRAVQGALRIHLEKGERIFDRTIAAKLAGPGGEQLLHETVLLVIERLEAERIHSREQHRATAILTRVLRPTPVPPERG